MKHLRNHVEYLVHLDPKVNAIRPKNYPSKPINNVSITSPMQYDFGGWMPNSPTTMELPPPKEKGTTTEKTILDTFPSVNTTVHAMSTVWLLSKQSSDSVSTHQRRYVLCCFLF